MIEVGIIQGNGNPFDMFYQSASKTPAQLLYEAGVRLKDIGSGTRLYIADDGSLMVVKGGDWGNSRPSDEWNCLQVLGEDAAHVRQQVRTIRQGK